MKKKKSRQSFTRHAIIGLPIELTFPRAVDMISHDPTAETEHVSDDQLDIVYQFTGDDKDALLITMSLKRWQGTQTLVGVQSYQDVAFLDCYGTWLGILGWFYIIAIGAMLYGDRSPLAIGFFIIYSALMIFYVIQVRHHKNIIPHNPLEDRVKAVALNLADHLADHKTELIRLVAQDDANESQHSDHLAIQHHHPRKTSQ